MDRCLRVGLLRALAALVAAAPLVSRAATFTILHVNDTHSHLEAVGPRDADLRGTVGGLEKAATVIAQARATTPDTLLVHAGDLFQGDVFFNATYGVAELQLLSQLGLDAIAIGNHEFHLGPQVLLGALAQAFPPGGSPALSANLDLGAFPALAAFVSPRTVKQVGAVRVGLFGLTTPFDPAEAPDPVTVASDVQQLLLIAATQAATLRAEGADVVVCLSHMGIQIDAALAANVPGLDAIVGGHDHLVLPQPLVVPGPGGRAVPIVQAGSYYEWVGKLTLSVDAGGVSVASYELLPVDATVPPFAPFAAAMQRIQAVVRASFGDVHAPVAFAPSGVSRAPGPLACLRDTGVGNLVTDALRAQTGTDVAVTANGLLPDGIAPGWALGIDLFRVVGDGFDVADVQAGRPFRSAPLYTLHVKGADLAAALETTLGAGIDDVFLQVSGMRYAYDSRRPAGQRLVGVEVAGEPLNLNRTYHATVDFGVVQALPLLGVTVSHVVAMGDHAYDAVLALATRLHVLDYASQGRIVDVAAPCE